MKRAFQIIVLLFGALVVVRGLLPERHEGGFHLQKLATLPVQDGGRIKPIDTVARSTLLMLRGRQTALDESGGRLSAREWLADVTLDRERAAEYKVFRVEDSGVLGLFGFPGDDVRHFSYRELQPFFQEMERQHASLPGDEALHNRYEQALVRLRTGIAKYQALSHSFYPPGTAGGPVRELEAFASVLPSGIEALNRREAGAAYDAEALERFLPFAARYREAAESARLRVVPPRDDGNEWQNFGSALLSGARDASVDPVVLGYARLAPARQNDDADTFNRLLDALASEIAGRQEAGNRTGFEAFVNRLQPFSVSLTLYVLVFLVATLSWLAWPRLLADTAFRLLLLAFAAHTFGIAARVYLSGYAPVTNLYSSAVFVGWAATLLSLFLEKLYRIGVGSAVAAGVGFCTLLVAHQLSMDGDTIEMMQAVLDSNFWLGTHVVVITIGYSAVFLAGSLGLLYVVRGVFTRTMSVEAAQALRRMVYGVLCFALLFSFTGTVLGGIWADQSWGRFWGWDPKENGALLIVIWLALALHARRGGLAGERGLMLLAIGGNIVTSWSWFGTNMLGLGLHSYGFTERGFMWLFIFWASQGGIILIGALPTNRWRSREIFRKPGVRAAGCES